MATAAAVSASPESRDDPAAVKKSTWNRLMLRTHNASNNTSRFANR